MSKGVLHRDNGRGLLSKWEKFTQQNIIMSEIFELDFQVIM